MIVLYEVLLKAYTFGCVMVGPGRRTRLPVPKERTG